MLDLKVENRLRHGTIPKEGLQLFPGQLYLAKTNEYTETLKHVPLLEGRSSIARLGIFIHVTAGFGDIGFKGNWTLEIAVIQPVKIYPDIEICQIYYHTTFGDTSIKYEGKYNSKEIQPSKIYKELQ
jgi:dCTP deaminase